MSDVFDLLEIDGSVLEGGGQILRISISLSAILGIPVCITNIRLHRKKPGLAAQHLTGIQLVADMCGARLKGDYIGSTAIEFRPGKIRGGHYLADVKTAGSISLLLQVALPVALMADDTVVLDLKGGTNAEMAPQIDYMDKVFRPMLKHFGAEFQLEIIKRGYYPKGGGHVRATVTTLRSLRPVTLTQPADVVAVKGCSFVAGTLPFELAHKIAEAAKGALSSVLEGIPSVDIRGHKENRQMAPDNCAGINLQCHLSNGCVLGADALGKRRVDAVGVGKMAGEAMRDAINEGSAVDPYAQDQLILYMALAEGRSAVRTGELTLHTRTAVHVTEIITKIHFEIHPRRDSYGTIECIGLGYVNPNMMNT